MQYSGALTKHTTVVIAADQQQQPSAKVQTALRHGIPVVHPQWLADTIAAGRVQPTNRYQECSTSVGSSPRTEQTCVGNRSSARRSYTSIELEVLRYTASPAVHDPRTLASVLRAARLIDAATQASPDREVARNDTLTPEQPAPSPTLTLQQPAPSPTPQHIIAQPPLHVVSVEEQPHEHPSPPHLLVRGGPPIPHPPRALLHAVHARHGHDCQPCFHSGVEVCLPGNRTLRFDVHGAPRVPLVLPDGGDMQDPLAAVRLEGVYDLDGAVWLAHCYYLNQEDLQRLPGGPIILAPHELVLRRKLYHSPAASIRGAALVFRRRGVCLRHAGRDDVDAAYFCERVHAG